MQYMRAADNCLGKSTTTNDIPADLHYAPSATNIRYDEMAQREDSIKVQAWTPGFKVTLVVAHLSGRLSACTFYVEYLLRKLMCR